AGERLGRLREVEGERRTLVYFEAPHRLDATLAAMAEVFGAERRAAVCRELTKTYEEVKRGGLGELAAWAAEGVRGEITVVVEG
ncbi:SAM-dependent methyltransferase, partial [Streptomyces virginiae]